MNDDEALTAGRAAKQTAILLRDARAVLRKLDTLAAQAAATEDPSLPRIAEARAVVTRLVGEYGHREQSEQRRARAALRRSRCGAVLEDGESDCGRDCGDGLHLPKSEALDSAVR